MLVPEVSAGWQIVGDPAANEFAVTLTGGAGPVFGAAFSNTTGFVNQLGVFVPVQLLVDVPVGDGALTFGARTIASASRFEGTGDTSLTFVVVPGLLASWTLPLGNGFFFRPELAASIPLGTSVALGDGAVVMGALALGYEFRWDTPTTGP